MVTASEARAAELSWSSRMRNLMDSYKASRSRNVWVCASHRANIKERFWKSDADKARALLRHKAVGDEKLPSERRVYAEIHFPYAAKLEPKHMFFNNAWSTVGRHYDADAAALTSSHYRAGKSA